jgi:hypothetical protein
VRRLVVTFVACFSAVAMSAPAAQAQARTFHDPVEDVYGDINRVVVSHTARTVKVDVFFTHASTTDPFAHVYLDTARAKRGPEFLVQADPDGFGPSLFTRSHRWNVGDKVACPKWKVRQLSSPTGYRIVLPRKCLANGRGIKPDRVRVNVDAVTCAGDDYAPSKRGFYAWVRSGPAKAATVNRMSPHSGLSGVTAQIYGC